MSDGEGIQIESVRIAIVKVYGVLIQPTNIGPVSPDPTLFILVLAIFSLLLLIVLVP